MASEELQACEHLRQELLQRGRPPASYSPLYVASCVNLMDVSSPDRVEQSIDACMDNLTRYFDSISLQRQLDDPGLSSFLAKITRESPFWRPRFGRSHGSQASEQHIAESIPPDCILEVARRIIARAWDESKREEVRSALRLVANCCADNNANRDVIVKRNGIQAMMTLAYHNRECDLLIPTMFNVCYQYNSPAIAEDGTPLPPLHETGEDKRAGAEEPTVNLAEQKLAVPVQPGQSTSSIEILLDMLPSAEHCIGLLADLVEMASHMALYGLHHIIPSPAATLTDGSEDLKSQDLKDRCSRLLDCLLTKGTQVIKNDRDAQVSICQATLNILSSPESHEAIIAADAGLWNFIHLPYVICEDELDADHEAVGAKETLAPFRKAFLKLVYQISSLDSYAEHSEPDSALIRDCIQALTARFQTDSRTDSGVRTGMDDEGGSLCCASMCVLIANSIISTGRAARLLESTGIATAVSTILRGTSDKELVLPAVDIATRLSLTPEGQEALCEQELLASVVRRLLDPNTAATDALGIEIQRQSVALARLLIKDRMASLSSLDPETETEGDGSITTDLLSLYQNTKDVRTRTEIGRFYIEILRTYFKTNQTSSSSSQFTESRLLHLISCPLQRPDITVTVADTIAFIITQPQPQGTAAPPTPSNSMLRTEAEAWFGLGLLSTIPNTRSEILTTLGGNGRELLKRLEGIARQQDSVAHTEISDVVPRSATAPDIDDPRYKNIRVLVVNLLRQDPNSDGDDKQKEVNERIREAAVIMDLDNVLS
ncbi:hypothetical protein PV08_09201 [Exophiala spinifera]|uniref:Uncharacterized protein n=1 Tax=Exophiala spinifera TaxID=91928 RepID=A0A0D2AZ01_9EURO|nr:uncharacterized protein PV08_09201 [Exophiala spinifera]KIW11928.1 hypothetical protein PV08_09201 [Exophiala spinifera]